MPEIIENETVDSDKNDNPDTAPAGNNNDEGGNQDNEKLIPQSELDRIVAKRLKRQEEQLLKKYADYDQKTADAEAYRKLQDEKATDAERWEKERAKYVADLKDRDERLTKLERANLIADLATDKKLPKSFWKRVTGDTEEEIAEDIDSMIKDLGVGAPEGGGEKTSGGGRKPGTMYGGGGDNEDPDPDAKDIVAKIPRGPQIRIEKPKSNK